MLFAALPQVLKERVFAFEDSEGQLHIIFLVNDILFERYVLNFSYGYLAIAVSNRS